MQASAIVPPCHTAHYCIASTRAHSATACSDVCTSRLLRLLYLRDLTFAFETHWRRLYDKRKAPEREGAEGLSLPTASRTAVDS